LRFTGVRRACQSSVARRRTLLESNLRGDYGFAVEGLILPRTGVTIPIRGVHMTHFDGNGKLTQVDSIILNGSPISDGPLSLAPITLMPIAPEQFFFFRAPGVCKPAHRGGQTRQGNPHRGLASV